MVTKYEAYAISIGDTVTATMQGSYFHLTPGKSYTVLDVAGPYVKVENETGVPDFYSLEYFEEFAQ